MLGVAEFLLGLAVGGVIAPTLKRLVERVHQRGELARDALVDINSFISELEDMLPKIVDVPVPEKAEDLVDTPSAYFVNGPMISLDRYLSCFDNEEIHRLFILLFDSHKKLVNASDELAVAFGWLIENRESWDSPVGQERLTVLKNTRASALLFVRCLLRYSSELCEHLAEGASRIPALSRVNRPSIEEFLGEYYGLSVATLRARAAYYRQEAASSAFNPRIKYGLYKWGDGVLTSSGWEFLVLTLKGYGTFQIRHGAVVALPMNSVVERIQAWKNGEGWEEFPALLLPELPPVTLECVEVLALRNSDIPLLAK